MRHQFEAMLLDEGFACKTVEAVTKMCGCFVFHCLFGHTPTTPQIELLLWYKFGENMVASLPDVPLSYSSCISACLFLYLVYLLVLQFRPFFINSSTIMSAQPVPGQNSYCCSLTSLLTIPTFFSFLSFLTLTLMLLAPGRQPTSPVWLLP